MAKFAVFYNGEPLKTFDLDEPVITIGRLPENTISIANMGVSRRHARIEEDTDRNLVLTDLNSLNGTFVNGKKVKKTGLSDNDKISIGKYVIIYKTETELQKNDGSGPEETVVPEDLHPATKSSGKIEKERFATSRPSKPDTEAPGPAIGTSDQPSQAVLIETSKHVVYRLEKPIVTIGSGETDDIFVAGFMVGKGQITIEHRDDEIVISEHKLMGKLKVNGRSLKTHVLKHKDRIEIGANTFRFMENG